MAVYQNGIDVSRYQGNINWGRVAAAGKQFAIVRVGSSNSGGLYVDPYFLQNVNGAKAAGLRVGAYYYTYARTRAAVANELTTFLNVMQGLQLEYPVFVDVEDASLTSLGRAELTSLVQYAMDILYQRKWYAGWYSYTNYINSNLNAAALSRYPLWVADYRATLGYNGSYAMWQYRQRCGQRHLRRLRPQPLLPGFSAGDTGRRLQQLWGLRPFHGGGGGAAACGVQRPVRVFLFRQLQRCGRLSAAGQLLRGQAERPEIQRL